MAEVTAKQRQKEVKDRKDFKEELKHQDERREEAVKRVRVTRERVLKGTGLREQVDILELGKEEEENTFFVMRPLTDGEFVEVQKTILGDISASSMDRDMKATDLIDREQKGKYLALTYALSIDNEEWTLEEIGKLPTGVPDKLYNRLAEISGFPRPTKPLSPPKKKQPG